MVITYYGASCFKAQSGETVLAFAPPSKESQFKSPRFQTNIVLINLNDKDYNGWENLSGKNDGKPPFVIDGPGEYEISGICVKGIRSGLNTIYSLSFDDITMCHLGALSDGDFDAKLKEDIGEIDILFVPTGKTTADILNAARIVAHLEPKIIIPMHYKEKDLNQFLKEFGNGSIAPVEKLTIKKKDLSDKKNQIVVLSPCI